MRLIQCLFAAALVVSAACGAKTIALPAGDGGAGPRTRDAAPIILDSEPAPPRPRDTAPRPIADAMPPPPPPVDATSGGRCDNGPDRRAIEALYGPAGDETIEDVAGSCGRACIADPDLLICTQACLLIESSSSADCAFCYAESFLCAVENCLPQCLVDADGEPCLRCRCGMNDLGLSCTGMFDACTGVTATACPR